MTDALLDLEKDTRRDTNTKTSCIFYFFFPPWFILHLLLLRCRWAREHVSTTLFTVVRVVNMVGMENLVVDKSCSSLNPPK